MVLNSPICSLCLVRSGETGSTGAGDSGGRKEGNEEEGGVAEHSKQKKKRAPNSKFAEDNVRRG